jgi:protein phosphatase
MTEDTPLPISSPPLALDVAALSETGAVRAHNEDVALVGAIDAEPKLSLRTSIAAALVGRSVLAVCDGMGGAKAGEVASEQAALSIGGYLSRLTPREDLAFAVAESVRVASAAVYELSRENPRFAGMGTTATVCAVEGSSVAVAQVGDSRAYLYRDERLRQITRDQTLAQVLVERGQLRPEDARSFPMSNVILQALGTGPTVDVDVRTLRIEPGDTILVCSDGLSGALDDDVLSEVLGTAANASLACARLVARALDAGATDNVTCIVARVVALEARGRRG